MIKETINFNLFYDKLKYWEVWFEIFQTPRF
jgi:hypothetical protein